MIHLAGSSANTKWNGRCHTNTHTHTKLQFKMAQISNTEIVELFGKIKSPHKKCMLASEVIDSGVLNKAHRPICQWPK